MVRNTGSIQKIGMKRPTMKLASGRIRLLVAMLLIIAFAEGLAQGAMGVLQFLNVYLGAGPRHVSLVLSLAGPLAYWPTGATW